MKDNSVAYIIDDRELKYNYDFFSHGHSSFDFREW